MTDDERLVNGQVMKHSGVVQINSNRVTLLQRKCFNILLANAYNDLEKNDTYCIKLWDICSVLGFHDIPELKDNLKKLVSTVIEFNTLQSRDKTIWEISSLLADAVIKDNLLLYSYSPLLRKKLHNPVVYARINLSVQRSFKTKYALALYELVCDHFIQNKGRGQTPFISLDDLRILMGCSDDKTYSDFKYLNRLIKKAVAEINDKSDLQIEVKRRKQSKSVVAVQFIITPTSNKSGMIAKLYTPKQTEMPLAPGGDLHVRLVREYKLSNKQATDIVNHFDPLYITDVLAYVAKKQAAGKVDNIASYTISAFTDRYVSSPLTPESLSNGNGNDSGIVLQEGMRIEIEDGTVYAVEEGDFIRIEGRGIITRGEIIRELKAGKFKVVAADAVSEYLAPDPNEDQAKQTTKPKSRKSRKGLHKAEE